MRKTLTDKGIASLKPREKRYSIPDPDLKGHYLRVMPTGRKSYCVVTTNPQTREAIWHTISASDFAGHRRRAGGGP